MEKSFNVYLYFTKFKLRPQLVSTSIEFFIAEINSDKKKKSHINVLQRPQHDQMTPFKESFYNIFSKAKYQNEQYYINSVNQYYIT